MTSPLFARIMKFTIFMLALTGMAQMPIFKRYYIADIPGLGWLADFYLTNKIHYIFGAVFLFMSLYLLTIFVMTNRDRIMMTLSGALRIVLYGLVVVTGLLRVVKNLQAVTFDPMTVLLIDWTHLGFAFLLGMAGLYAYFRGRRPYLLKIGGIRT
ncbi:iron-sulfur cluster-binding protein [Maridesulfovibrio sp.]|uniref:iron-sulfur cluster-binding protein n=1 Tax=unclassified Maridesulfovibrio TaxID=2794999 RepID=UPI003AFF8975